MPAKFYPLLDPDGWPKQPKENDWHQVKELLPDVILSPDNLSSDISSITTN